MLRCINIIRININKNVPSQNIIVIESLCFELPPDNELNIKIQRDLMVNRSLRIKKSPLNLHTQSL